MGLVDVQQSKDGRGLGMRLMTLYTRMCDDVKACMCITHRPMHVPVM